MEFILNEIDLVSHIAILMIDITVLGAMLLQGHCEWGYNVSAILTHFSSQKKKKNQ